MTGPRLTGLSYVKNEYCIPYVLVFIRNIFLNGCGKFWTCLSEFLMKTDPSVETAIPFNLVSVKVCTMFAKGISRVIGLMCNISSTTERFTIA